MTMSISSAPAATASRVSASLTGSAARPDGNAVATAATLTPEPRQRSLAAADQVVVDADRGDGGRRRVGRVGALRLGAQRADLAGGVRALQRGQVDHRDRQVDARTPWRSVLIDRVAEVGRPRLGAHLVDARAARAGTGAGSPPTLSRPPGRSRPPARREWSGSPTDPRPRSAYLLETSPSARRVRHLEQGRGPGRHRRGCSCRWLTSVGRADEGAELVEQALQAYREIGAVALADALVRVVSD